MSRECFACGRDAVVANPPPPEPGHCPRCYAAPGPREQDCGAASCQRGECLHNHHDGCPACLDDEEKL